MKEMKKMIRHDSLVEITPEVIAELFADMSSDEQARFFNHIDRIASKWLDFQLQYITDEDGLTLAGRRVMDAIGNYSHWGMVPYK